MMTFFILAPGQQSRADVQLEDPIQPLLAFAQLSAFIGFKNIDLFESKSHGFSGL